MVVYAAGNGGGLGSEHILGASKEIECLFIDRNESNGVTAVDECVLFKGMPNGI